MIRERQTVLWSLPALLLLSGCGGSEPECDSLDTRDSVVKTVSGDSNNALVNYAAKNSSVVEAMVNNANTEAEKSAIWKKARQGASYRLDDTVSTNSKSKYKRAVTCSALLYATVEDATAQTGGLYGGTSAGWEGVRFGQSVSILSPCTLIEVRIVVFVTNRS
jgi:hypothetical protein